MLLVSFIRPDGVRLTKQSVFGAISAEHPCQVLTYQPEHAVGLHQLVSLGHATLAETRDTYGHLFADAEVLGCTAVDLALKPVLAEQRRNRVLSGAYGE
jgi:hypothetical protein